MATKIPVIFLDDDSAITTIDAWTCHEPGCPMSALTKFGVCEDHSDPNGGDGPND